MAGFGGVRTAHDVKCEEKEDFKALNDKLANLVGRLKQNGPGDSNNFLTSLQSVEDEVAKLKRLYEDELDNLRRQLDAANRDRNKYESEADRANRVAADLEDRFNAEANKNAGLLAEIHRLQNRIGELEQELASIRSASRVPETQLAASRDDLRQAQARNQQLAAELDMEREGNRHMKDKVADLEQKLDFNQHLHNEQLKEANGRMDKSKALIGQLEAKAKEMESQSASMPGMLAAMRQKMDQELEKYKAETEAAHNKNMAALKQQMDNQSAGVDQLRATVSRLQGENDNLQAKIRGIEGQVRELKTQKGSLEDQLRQERGRSIDQIKALEKKLKDLQDMMFVKMQEANVNRDVQVSLRTELEAYRMILNEAERGVGRTATPKAGTMYNPNATSNYGMATGFNTGTPRPVTNGNRYLFTDEELKSGHGGGERSASVAASTGQLARYIDLTEYRDSYCGQDTFRRAQNMNESNTAFKARTCADGLPKLTPAETGNSRLYMSRTPEVRVNSSYPNSRDGQCRNSFPRVH